MSDQGLRDNYRYTLRFLGALIIFAAIIPTATIAILSIRTLPAIHNETNYHEFLKANHLPDTNTSKLLYPLTLAVKYNMVATTAMLVQSLMLTMVGILMIFHSFGKFKPFPKSVKILLNILTIGIIALSVAAVIYLAR